MLITVAIPIYNAERYLRQSIESVLSQTYTNFELILTDDGSNDGSLEIMRSYQDPRIIVVCDGMHKGLAVRLNEQIAMARGMYFARMDADDVMLPQRLERQVEFVRLHPETDAVGSSTIVIDELGNRLGWRGMSHWKKGAGRKSGDLGFIPVHSFMHPTVMGRTQWFRRYYYNPACEGCEDMDLWFRSRLNSHFYSLYEPLLLYRDPQNVNLETYLFRRDKERYVLRLNSGGLSWIDKQYRMIRSWLKSFCATLLCRTGNGHILLRLRNDQQSVLNNNIVHVITSLRTGGAEKLMVDLLPILSRNGEDVKLVVMDGVRTPFYDALEKSGVPIISLRTGKNVYDIRNIFSLRKYIKKADIVHTHNTAAQYFAAIANIGVGTSLVTTEHSTSNRRRGIPLFRVLDRWMYRQYKCIITVSDISGNNIKEYTGNEALPVKTIPNGIDFKKFSTADAINDLIKAKEGFFVGVIVAGFRYEKDHPTVFRAFSLLPTNYHLLVVGDGDRRNEYVGLIKELKCEDRIHLLGIRADVPNILRSADFVIMSSHREGLSLSNLEGMACGRPFIASDVDGLHEIVDGYGVLFAHEDEKALADAIRKCCEDKVFAQEVARRCQERARMFDIELMAEKYDHEYQKLLEG